MTNHRRKGAHVLGLLAAPLIAAVLAACGGDDSIEVTQGTVIRNATVVNTRDGSLTAGQAIVIDGGKIVRIVPAEAVNIGGTAQSIDATGKYVVPGFLDMHTHSMVRIDSNPTYFPLMIANGITGFREMGEFPGGFANMVQRARQLNVESAAGRVDAPEVLLVPSEIFSAVTSAASAVQGVAQQKALGVDFIKLIGANRDATLAFLSEAKSQNLYVTGHLSPAVSAAESSRAGWKTIEHLGSGAMGILLDCATDEASLRQTILAAAGNNAPAYPSDAVSLQRVVNTYSGDKCRDLANVFVQNGTWHVPTLRRVRGIVATDNAAFASDPNLAYVDKTRLALWAQSAQTFARRPSAEKAALLQVYALQQSVTRLLKQSGVKMLAGSDAGRASTWVVPGFGLHEDFHELAASGLTPLEILQMATLNGAEFLNRQSTMGTVDEGKNADLVLLDANPVLDATNLDKIAGVVMRGKYFAKEALDKMKSDVATLYRNAPAAAVGRPTAEDDHVH